MSVVIDKLAYHEESRLSSDRNRPAARLRAISGTAPIVPEPNAVAAVRAAALGPVVNLVRGSKVRALV